MTHRAARALAVATVGLLTAVLAPVTTATAHASGDGFAPLDRPGPALSVPRTALRAALDCHGRLRGSDLEPVLLNPATGVTPKQNYAWNYERAFDAQGRPWCALTMPHHTLGDIQTAGEYLVFGIRTMYHRAGRRIAVMGHSQGGMSMRWALRFWPDTRPMVDDVIGMAGSNHGTTALQSCRPGLTRCTPAVWQQLAGSDFLRALNSRTETFPSISYTEVYTHTDEVVQPNSAAQSSSSLTPGPNVTNVATQEVCPLDTYEHLAVGTVDPVAYALAMDALDHRGPARISRIDPAVCGRVYQPGVNPLNARMYLRILRAAPTLASVALPYVNPVGAPEVPREPELRCYVYAAGCDS
ncbi:MAG TPA: lipase [Nocardioidaceae bacterium]|nr:lipase [Nocardioidaceae bacterium]